MPIGVSPVETLGQVAEAQDWKCWAEDCNRGLIPITMAVPAVGPRGQQGLLCLACAELAADCYRPTGDPELARMFGIDRKNINKVLALHELGRRALSQDIITQQDWMEVYIAPTDAAKRRASERIKRWVREKLWPEFDSEMINGRWVYTIGNPAAFMDLMARILDSLAASQLDEDDEPAPNTQPWKFFRRRAS
jgi:hypothetical protein